MLHTLVECFTTPDSTTTSGSQLTDRHTGTSADSERERETQPSSTLTTLAPSPRPKTSAHQLQAGSAAPLLITPQTRQKEERLAAHQHRRRRQTWNESGSAGASCPHRRALPSPVAYIAYISHTHTGVHMMHVSVRVIMRVQLRSSHCGPNEKAHQRTRARMHL